MKGEETYKESLKQIVNNLPEKPGCYQYMDEAGKVIYVGKAKNLKKRVSSYFQKEQQSYKTKVLVSRIYDIKYIVVGTEWDALLLENSLIKRYKPRYNILLKDDKTYPSICITKEEFPRIFKTRKIINNGSKYYGPYSHVGTLNMLLDLVKQIYSIKTCKYPLTEESIKKGLYKECLEYHIKKCKAPCIGLESREDYNRQVNEIKKILDGKAGELTKELLLEIKRLAGDLKFEEAQVIKNRYETIKTFGEKSQVVNSTLDNVDVFSAEEDDNIVFINYFHVYAGFINQAFTFEYRKKLDESLEEILLMGVAEMRSRFRNNASEIIVPFIPETESKGITWTVPTRGDKKKLLDLSLLNVKQYRFDRVKRMEKLNPEQKHLRLMKELQGLLKLEHTPIIIECFDNSHISGSDAVAACVVYENCKPLKKDYRLYNIKSAQGGDDYGSMYEVLFRRYSRILEDRDRMPDLIIVDGGKGQMSIAKEVSDNLGINLNIAGLVKNNHHKTSGLLFGFPQMEIGIKPDSELFRLLQQMQEEVHRVAISFHKKKRSKKQLGSELTDIKGIGEGTSTILLREFKSVKRISEASEEELSRVIGNSKAKTIIDWFKNKTK